MKKYLVMGGYFIGNVTINADGQICDDKYFRGSTDIAEDYYEPICHAINSHDELVEMNKDLLAALEGSYALAACHAATYQSHHKLEDIHEKHRQILNMSAAAIDKAKGGEA